MPNHTTNFVTIETNTNVQEEIQALDMLKNDLRIKEDEFDFNGVIRMPNEIRKGTEMSLDNCSDDYELDNGVFVPKRRLIRKRLMAEYGADNWRDFGKLHWGTKWNSYEVEILTDEEHILFVSFLKFEQPSLLSQQYLSWHQVVV